MVGYTYNKMPTKLDRTSAKQKEGIDPQTHPHPLLPDLNPKKERKQEKKRVCIVLQVLRMKGKKRWHMGEEREQVERREQRTSAGKSARGKPGIESVCSA